ncbi:hypothetical protein HDV05_008104 [Chytridiales sp. JEL 0842]|nr:hypothetical protein HDV05_008104 [Chytridiales sp. JEL 0842]
MEPSAAVSEDRDRSSDHRDDGDPHPQQQMDVRAASTETVDYEPPPQPRPHPHQEQYESIHLQSTNALNEDRFDLGEIDDSSASEDDDPLSPAFHPDNERTFLKRNAEPLNDHEESPTWQAANPSVDAGEPYRRPSGISKSGDEGGWMTDRSEAYYAEGGGAWTSDPDMYDDDGHYVTSGGENGWDGYDGHYVMSGAEDTGEPWNEDDDGEMVGGMSDWEPGVNPHGRNGMESSSSSVLSIRSFHAKHDSNYSDGFASESVRNSQEFSDNPPTGKLYSASEGLISASRARRVDRDSALKISKSVDNVSVTEVGEPLQPSLPRHIPSPQPAPISDPFSQIGDKLKEVSNDDPFLVSLLNMNAQHFQQSFVQGPNPAKTAQSIKSASSNVSPPTSPDDSSNKSPEATFLNPIPQPSSIASSSSSAPHTPNSFTKKLSLFKNLRTTLSKEPSAKSKFSSLRASKETIPETTTEVVPNPTDLRPPLPATIARSEKTKAYLEARYKQLQSFEESGSEGRKMGRYNPLVVLRWRREAWQRAVRSKNTGGGVNDEARKWRLRPFSWYVANADLDDYLKDVSGQQNPLLPTEGGSASGSLPPETFLTRLKDGDEDGRAGSGGVVGVARTMSARTMTSSSSQGDLMVVHEDNTNALDGGGDGQGRRKHSRDGEGDGGELEDGVRRAVKMLPRPFAGLRQGRQMRMKKRPESVASAYAASISTGMSSEGRSKFRKQSADLLDVNNSMLLAMFVNGNLGVASQKPGETSVESAGASKGLDEIQTEGGTAERLDSNNSNENGEQSISAAPSLVSPDVNPLFQGYKFPTSPTTTFDEQSPEKGFKRPSFQVGTGVKNLTQLLTGRRKGSTDNHNIGGVSEGCLDVSAQQLRLDVSDAGLKSPDALGEVRSSMESNRSRSTSPSSMEIDISKHSQILSPVSGAETSTKPSRAAKDRFFSRTKRNNTAQFSDRVNSSDISLPTRLSSDNPRIVVTNDNDQIPIEDAMGPVAALKDTLVGAAENIKKMMRSGRDREDGDEPDIGSLQGGDGNKRSTRSLRDLMDQASPDRFDMSSPSKGDNSMSRRRLSKPLLFWGGDADEEMPVDASKSPETAKQPDELAASGLETASNDNLARPRFRQGLMRGVIDSIRPKSEAYAGMEDYDPQNQNDKQPRLTGRRKTAFEYAVGMGDDMMASLGMGGRDTESPSGSQGGDSSSKRRIRPLNFTRGERAPKVSKSSMNRYRQTEVEPELIPLKDGDDEGEGRKGQLDSSERRKKKGRRKFINISDSKTRLNVDVKDGNSSTSDSETGFLRVGRRGKKSDDGFPASFKLSKRDRGRKGLASPGATDNGELNAEAQSKGLKVSIRNPNSSQGDEDTGDTVSDSDLLDEEDEDPMEVMRKQKVKALEDLLVAFGGRLESRLKECTEVLQKKATDLEGMLSKLSTLAKDSNLSLDLSSNVYWATDHSHIRYLEFQTLRSPLPQLPDNDTHNPPQSPQTDIIESQTVIQSLTSTQKKNSSLLSQISAFLTSADRQMPLMVKRIDELAVEVNQVSSRRLKAIEEWIHVDERRRQLGGSWKAWSVEFGYQALAALLTVIAFLIWTAYQVIKGFRFIQNRAKHAIWPPPAAPQPNQQQLATKPQDSAANISKVSEDVITKRQPSYLS